MPWEVTEEYIRSGHRSTSEFQEGSLRTITLSEEEGIKAVIGKPKGQDTTEVQSYLFDKTKWTLEKAKAWFKEHRTQRARERVNVLMPFQVMRKMTDKPLKIRGVATMAGIDKNLHIITEDELQKFAEKLVAAPIYYEHIQAQNVVGKVTRTEFDPETKALFYEAEIYDEDAQQKIRMGLINHVSIGANYGRLDVLDGIAFYDLYDAELSLVAVPAVSGTSIQVMQKLIQKTQTGPTGAKVSPAPSNATESSGMEEKKIEEKFQEIDKKLERISQHLKVPKPQTIPQILQNIDSKMANIEKRLSKIERANEDEAAVELTSAEIKQKIADLTSQKAALTEKLEGATEEEKSQIQEQIDSLNLEIQALQKALEAKTAGSTNEGGVEQKLGQAVIVPQETKGDQESTLKDLSLREVMEAQQ